MSVTENLLGKHREVDAPVAPNMTSIVLVVFVWIVVCIQILTKSIVLLDEEVFLSNGYPEELGFGRKETGHLLVELRIVLLHTCRS